jgi:hypothetical protein
MVKRESKDLKHVIKFLAVWFIYVLRRGFQLAFLVADAILSEGIILPNIMGLHRSNIIVIIIIIIARRHLNLLMIIR